MNKAVKQKTPLLFLVGISIFWGYYYQSNSRLNDFGAANYEWLFLLDGLLVLPILCFLCIKDKKQAAIKAVVMSCLVVLIGSYIIPEQNKFIWYYLESGRYVVLALFLLFEITAIVTVFLAIKAALNQGADADLAISQPIKRFLGDGAVAQILMFEARTWTYALFSKGITHQQFSGDEHFSYHQKDGAESNLFGFVILILIEIPLMHLLLHFTWSPMAATIATLLTFVSLVFFFAEYRALSRRPISISQDNLIIRYGLYAPLIIPLGNIASIENNQAYVPRSKQVKRYNYAGTANVVITLIQPEGSVQSIYLGVDSPVTLIEAVRQLKS
ncbi:hypothetical protein MNBD_GAMMA02-1353 [hydrothermal vent metagenome]|uniref:Uncharacterized protein n=1 Tax=hydrothermal vent metagenome TaxID=652676 RepID=A0A3B0VPZ9_9ZZZZ